MCGIYYFAIVFVPNLAWIEIVNSCAGISYFSFEHIDFPKSYAFLLWTKNVNASTGSFMMWITIFTMSARRNPWCSYSNDPYPWVIDLILSTKSMIISDKGSSYFKMYFLSSTKVYEISTPRLLIHTDFISCWYSLGNTIVPKTIGSR